MIYQQISPKVSVAEKIKEYYKVNKYLGGLIKVTEVLRTESMGREICVFIPELNKHDVLLINGVKFAPTPEKEGKV